MDKRIIVWVLAMMVIRAQTISIRLQQNSGSQQIVGIFSTINSIQIGQQQQSGDQETGGQAQTELAQIDANYQYSATNESVLPQSSSWDQLQEQDYYQSNYDLTYIQQLNYDQEQVQNDFQYDHGQQEENRDQEEDIDEVAGQSDANLEQEQFQQYSIYSEQFNDYMDGLNRKYSNEQKQLRYLIYLENHFQIIKHNSDSNNTFFLRSNDFADLSNQEFQNTYLMTLPDQPPKAVTPPMAPPKDLQASAVDWRQFAPTSAKVQGSCGSCWAFSLTSAMETIIKINKGVDYDFSEQQMVDCCQEGCQGCSGGWPAAAANCVAQIGVALSSDYPYKGFKRFCKKDISTKWYINKQFPFSQTSSVQSLIYAIQSGPVAVVIDASSWSMLYGGGLFNRCIQDGNVYNHAVTLMGMEADGTWIIRNSWGTKWGDNGHIYISSGNSCSISSFGVVPTINFSAIESSKLGSEKDRDQSGDY